MKQQEPPIMSDPLKGSMSHKRLHLESTDTGKAIRGIGLVAPFDFALDSECWRWLPSATSLQTSTPLTETLLQRLFKA